MSQARREHVSERIPKELIEADFEIAFTLIDMSLAEFDHGHHESASRALHDAGDVLTDIERRLKLIGTYDQQSFEPLVGELKRALSLAQGQVQ